MGFKLENLGTWSQESPPVTVDAERVKAYAEATNDDLPEHANGELAPPLFACVPLFEVAVSQEALNAVVDLTPKEASGVLHGEHDLIIHQPIRPGMLLRLKAAVVGVHAKPRGTTVVSRIETVDEAGVPVNTQFVTSFVRNVVAEESGGEQAPDHRTHPELQMDQPLTEVTQHFDDDQTFRYAAASGDQTPVHLDENVAKSVGLPGIIIHGLCTMAFVSHAVITSVADAQPQRLKRLAVRFSQVARPGQAITTRIWDAGERTGRRCFAFVTTGPDGQPVLTNGLAEIEA